MIFIFLSIAHFWFFVSENFVEFIPKKQKLLFEGEISLGNFRNRVFFVHTR